MDDQQIAARVLSKSHRWRGKEILYVKDAANQRLLMLVKSNARRSFDVGVLDTEVGACYRQV